jgi:hypothetical protein
VPHLVAGSVDENPPHGFRGGSKKMPTAIPGTSILTVGNQPHVCLVHQSSRL